MTNKFNSTYSLITVPNKQIEAGFTLVEIAVAVLILAIGILGVAGMQSVGVRESQNTYFRSQANLLASDLVEKMRANAIESRKGGDSAYLEEDPQSSCSWSASSCDSVSIAEFDLSNWEEAVQNSGLPNAGQAVNFVEGVSDSDGQIVTAIYDIQVFWDEEREGEAPEDCEAANGGCVSWRVQI